MKALIHFPLLLAAFFACQRKMPAKASTIVSEDTLAAAASAFAPSAPACILQKIDSIKRDHVWNPPAEIHEYENEGKKVYVISADCCDRFTTVVDSNCNYICAPSGGFTGRGDGKCRDFFTKAKHIRLVWKDERTRK